MFSKIGFVGGVVVGIAVVMVLLTIMMPTIKTFTDYAANDTFTGNYSGYTEAAAAAPIWIYAIPLLIGGAAIFVKLREKEE